jgi:hypothetical protein
MCASGRASSTESGDVNFSSCSHNHKKKRALSGSLVCKILIEVLEMNVRAKSTGFQWKIFVT